MNDKNRILATTTNYKGARTAPANKQDFLFPAKHTPGMSLGSKDRSLGVCS